MMGCRPKLQGINSICYKMNNDLWLDMMLQTDLKNMIFAQKFFTPVAIGPLYLEYDRE